MITPFSVLFFRGSGIAAFFERLFCRIPGQPVARVPGHCGVRIGDSFYEATAGGVHRIPYAHAKGRPDLLVEIALLVNAAQAAQVRSFCERCVGRPYSWADIAIDALAALCPDLPFPRKPSKTGEICSLFALGACLAAPLRVIAGEEMPCTSPNELMLRLQDYVAATG